MRYVCVLLVFFLCGCVQISRSELGSRSTNAKIERKQLNSASFNGSIYESMEADGSYYQSMFEDSRPKNVGDLLIVDLKEDFSASHSASSNGVNEEPATVPATTESFWDWLFGNNNTDTTAATNNAATPISDDGSAKNAFNGTIAVTVSKVLPNGDLQIFGERKITINRGTKVLRFSGVVNPKNIAGSNTVASSKIANARIEYVDDVKNVAEVVDNSFLHWIQELFSSMTSTRAQ